MHDRSDPWGFDPHVEGVAGTRAVTARFGLAIGWRSQTLFQSIRRMYLYSVAASKAARENQDGLLGELPSGRPGMFSSCMILSYPPTLCDAQKTTGLSLCDGVRLSTRVI